MRQSSAASATFAQEIAETIRCLPPNVATPRAYDPWGLAFGFAAEWTASKWCGTLMEHASRILIWPLSIRRSKP